jgi:GntR family transcriptional regulator
VAKPDVRTSSRTLSLDKGGFIPLYHQIQSALIERIHTGELSVGDCLPSEYELARSYQVSRITARQALHNLKSRGYAISQKGRGTYVTQPKLEKNIMHLRGFTEDMKRRGMVPSSRLLEQSVLPSPVILQSNSESKRLPRSSGFAAFVLRTEPQWR